MAIVWLYIIIYQILKCKKYDRSINTRCLWYRGKKLTYASNNENNKEIYTFTANEPVTWSISGGEKGLFSIEQDTGKLSF